jgi:hypothetical protein
VIAVGRRQDLLDSFVQEHGADKAASFNLDISKLDTIPDFVKRYAVSSVFQRIRYDIDIFNRVVGQCDLVPSRFRLRLRQLGDSTAVHFQ